MGSLSRCFQTPPPPAAAVKRCCICHRRDPHFPPLPLPAQHARLPGHLLVIGASANLGKLLLMDNNNGSLLVGGTQDHMLAAPLQQEDGCDGDAVLRWMEEWARRLEAGWYEVGELGADRRRRGRGISLYPVVPPAMATAVTRGVQVRGMPCSRCP